ncbi:bifunctional 3-(3-hydroxy-phenyl)propionate/3-hydroxycinnamic acid hydroxylase MhpA [Mycolicibacterium confluentis]|uniref:3-(3-hydroxyphenyl)propionate hydroxylase n=1 Tax=Mycolicibacterium confluentis TaxID=28047 RepID=A0A7I7XQH7_9MYCO|nr:bifunctional 3-(3-hydroxy-phenyl)propionate/3-hydroxycinnamic acid hydroxylase [Mycolicibacterium confluentis]MCV7322457.1 bifunctional 3-(3-hydroxy-phenyl)propionate/3-hydroxycinnamic acid hydroxylase [Mycolicibacterium confluentis]ORV22463.1 3-(3-hydroxyphenyl)propionate hydroxylase [Mycolicibacterium confluentis]BBZ31507.1 3-(3-hydroxyphenyl)propionate hydroxylase [Mycolicibacterium confluentis]
MSADGVDYAPVVIVGAGPTGITAATLLAQYGVATVTLDRWSEVYPQPRAVHVDDEVCRILARLGLAESFAAVSRPAHGLQLRDRSQRVLAEFRRDTRPGRNGFPQANMFDQPVLEALLRANLQRHPLAELRGNVEVVNVDVAPPGRARVTYLDRNTGRERDIEADYVLGCDGANSVVRARIGAAMKDLCFNQRWLVIDVGTAVDLRQWDGVHQICDPRRAGTFMRIGATRYRWEFRLLPGESVQDFATLDALRPLLSPWIGAAADSDLELIRVAEYTFRAQVADRWRRGAVLLLGDAAHLTPPFVGQGMGAGLRDAMNLCWKLAGVLAGDLTDCVLDTYEQERKPHTTFMIGMALAIGWAMTAGGDFGSAIRRLVVPWLHRLPGVRRRVVDSTTPQLRRSALVCRKPLRRSLVGGLCPNPPLPEGGSLDDELGRGFSVVTAVALSESDRRIVEERGARVHHATAGSVTADWLRRGRVTAAVVRPDRTVMVASRDLGVVCDRVPSFHCGARHHDKGRLR